MTDEKLHQLIINQLDYFSKKIEDVDDKIDRVSNNMEFLKGMNAERINDIREIKETLKKNSEEHQQFTKLITEQSIRLVSLEDEEKIKRESKINKIGWGIAIFLGFLGTSGTLISYFF